MPCRCSDRRIAIGNAIHSTFRGMPGAIAPAARMVVRTTVEDVEAMARRMAHQRCRLASGMPRGTLRSLREHG